MTGKWCWLLMVVTFASAQKTEEDAKKFYEKFNKEAAVYCKQIKEANWKYATNITKATEEAKLKTELAFAKFDKIQKEEFGSFNWKAFQNDTLKRLFKKGSFKGSVALEESKYEKLMSIITQMKSIYAKTKICNYKNPMKCDVPLDPDLTKLMATSRDYDELLNAWKQWHENSGRPMRKLYEEYVELSNEAAKLNNLNDNGEMWRLGYESDTFVEDVENLWKELEPKYKLLHAYVRRKLMNQYGELSIRRKGPIPAHLLGNMWAQTWGNIFHLMVPFPNKKPVDISDALTQNKIDVKKMFEISEEFFTSLGLEKMTETFWNKSMLEKPKDGREVICHASAWDFCDGEDVRIKMCTEVNQEDLFTVHHEMGHIQYYLQYKDQPLLFQRGANPGFHEAIGDTLVLSVSTPSHLKQLGLLDEVQNDHEADINQLLEMALDKIAFLPFGYAVDKYRWDVFSGKITKEEYNKKWWEMRKRYQGIEPAVSRSESDFDPAAKYHVAADVPYVRYFVSFVIQFQFYEALCIKANQYDPTDEKSQLHKCDIYHNKEAGDVFKTMLRMGSSKLWPEAMKVVTDQEKMSSSSLIKYFEPLWKFLEQETKGEEIGWEDFSATEEDAQETFEKFNKEATDHCNELNEAEWKYETDINPDTEKQNLEVQLKLAAFQKRAVPILQKYQWKEFKNNTLKRLFQKSTILGQSALDNSKLKKLKDSITAMSSRYGTTKICSFTDKSNCNLQLDPDLTKIMANSHNYDELLYVWQQWHEKSGRRMREHFKTYVELSNEAAKLNGFQNNGELWRIGYESDSFVDDVEKLWQQLKPKYQQLHAYVRRKLIQKYGTDKIKADGPIPAHLLGNMWAQRWRNIFDLVIPYPKKKAVNVTGSMLNENYSVIKMFKTSEEFFTSLHLEEMPESFWNKSIFVRQPNKEMICHASAWDFCRNKDVRIKMCTEVNQVDLFTVHHEMGHIEYFLQYKNQPYPFRDGANPGFHEAIGDTLVLSVSTPQHLKKIRLLDKVEDDNEADINHLLGMALDKIAFLPFGYLIDKYRWDIFSGKITADNYNAKWWEMRKEYQGIEPSIPRSETDFDAGAKYHVAADVPYIRYFVSFVIQFQFHEALCKLAGQYDSTNPSKPLHKCDIYQNEKAGLKFSEMLKMGSSQPWPEAMKVLTGQEKMDASSIIEYFKPLWKFLEEQNKNEHIGWDGQSSPKGSSDRKTSSPLIFFFTISTVLLKRFILD